MLTLREAASLLASATTISHLRAIAGALGFDGNPARLDASARCAFGLDGAFGDAEVVPGPGAMRALLFSAQPGDARELLARAAARLTARAPYGLWVLIGFEPASCRVVIAAASPSQRGAKVAALIADRTRILDSDAETLRQLVAARSPDDLATHASFVDILGRDALTRRFFRELEACVGALAASAGPGKLAAKREIALLYASRLLFLGFLESKGWLDDDVAFLTRAFDGCMARGGGFHARVLRPLFFGTLNTPYRSRAPRAREFGRIPFLNGGLFTPTPVERGMGGLSFSDEACGRFFGELFSRFRFTALEETSTFEEAAVDPEMLGRAFESLMEGTARQRSGTYYTPQALVRRVCDLAIEESLGGDPGLETLRRVRVVDPACGSGAFLVHMLDRLSALRIDAGDGRPPESIRREVLCNSIFGVDLNATAVWLCQLRLWLSIVVDSKATSSDVAPLPNLDRNIRIGDSLAGPAFGDVILADGRELRRLRARYARSTGARKATLARELDRQERRLVLQAARAELARTTMLRRDLVVARRGRDLFGGRYAPSREEAGQAERLRRASLDARRRIRAIRNGAPLPFAFPTHFAEVAADGGFDIVVGNPPWVRPHHLDPATRETLRRGFVVARSAPWMAGAIAAGSGRAFASQVDLASVFVERSLRLLSSQGVLSLLLPAKLWRSLSAGGLRDFLTTEGSVRRLEDYSDVPSSFDAAVYPGLLVATRDTTQRADVGVTVLHRSRTAAHWQLPAGAMSLDGSAGAPWLLLPPEVRHSFETMRSAGIPLSETRFGRPLLGVKCGLNDAFIVSLSSSDGDSASIAAANGREGQVPLRFLRPVLRGHELRPWRVPEQPDCILWTHGVDGAPMPGLDPALSRWLTPYRRALAARADARRASRWWALFRTEAGASDRPRVVWADIGREVRATVLRGGDPTVPLNTCYAIRCRTTRDALALSALLNSTLASAWLSVIAEQARGGYRRYLGWTMGLLPIPQNWDACAPALAALAERALGGAHVPRDELLAAAIAAYGLDGTDVDALLAWAAE